MSADRPGSRLDSWKEIASYLKRHVTTVRRWEKQEGLPVHRHLHAKLGSVYAYANELDSWFHRRGVAPQRLSPPATFPPPPALRVPGSPIPLVGRDPELKILRSAWDDVRAGRQQVILLAGEPGAGKTRLAFDFARAVAPEATVLVGRCDVDAVVPFAPFVEILRWLVRAIPADVLQAHLANIDGRAELEELVPDIGRLLPRTREWVVPTAEGRRYRMFEAVVQFLQSTAPSRPMLLLFDDLHWADRGSMLLLRHLIRSTHETSILVVASCDEAELRRSPSLEIVADLRREASATRIALANLTERGVREFVEAWAGPDVSAWLSRLVFEKTKGNPLFMVELARHLGETGSLGRADVQGVSSTFATAGVPDSIRELIDRRVARLSGATRTLLTVAAVVGYEFSLSVTEAAVDLSPEVVLQAIEEALAAGMISEVPGAPGRFSFTYVLIRDALYTGLAAVRRVRWHRRIGEVLEQQCSAGDVLLGELAHHFGEAAVSGNAEKAFEYATHAGDQAATGLALEEAARFYGLALRALDHLPHDTSTHERRLDIRLRCSRSLLQVGRWASAKAELEVALKSMKPGQEALRCEALVGLAQASFWLMDVVGARRAAAEARVLAERLGRDDLLVDAHAWLSSASIADGAVIDAIESDRRAIARVGGIRSFAQARAPLTLYWAGRTAEAVDRAIEAVAAARASQDPGFLLYALQHCALALSGAGRYDDALSAFDEARTFGRRCGALPLLARATSMSVAPLLSVGDLAGATARAFEARELAQRIAFEPPFVSAGIDLLLIFARSHEPGRGEDLLEEVALKAQSADAWHGWKWRLRLTQARAELALARGHWTQAATAAGYVVSESRKRCRPKYEALGLAASARAHDRLRPRQAVDDARAAVAVARRLGDPAVLLECLNVMLKLDGSDALLAEAEATVQRILSGLSREELRRAFLESLSSAPRRRGKRSQAARSM